MNHDQATRFFDVLGEATVSRPPIADLVAAGGIAERRKRRLTIGASAAAVVLVLGGGVAVRQATGVDEPAPPTDRVVHLPTPQDGMRFAGMGRVVVEVPGSWGSEHECAPNVIAPATACQQGEEATWTLSFFELEELHDVEIDRPRESLYNEVQVIEGTMRCPATASCIAPLPYVVQIPGEGIGFTLGGGSGADSLRDAAIVESIRLLPKGFTTVPYLQLGVVKSEAERLIGAAGLEPRLGAPDLDLPIVGTQPTGGTIVQEGSTVTLLHESDRPRIEGTWTALLSGITGGADLESTHRDTTFTLSFENGMMRGDDECNQFGADYTQSGRELRFGPIDSTAIGCDTTEVITRVLNDVRHVTGSENRLYLHAHHWGIVLSLRPASGEASSSAPKSLTCPSEMRAVASPPFFDESAPGATTPEGAVEAWLDGALGRSFGPDYVMDPNKKHAWILRADGTAEARVTVKLTVGGGYFYYGHEACG